MTSKEETHESKKKRLLKTDTGVPSNTTEAKKVKIEAQALTEEQIAASHDPVADLESFKHSCDFLKSAIKNIKELKKGKPDTKEINAVRTDATIHFIHLKKLNRLAHFRCRKVRDKTHEAKHKIDQCHLQLQNLLYEAMHLEKEITKCMEFKSKDEDIELVPLEQFYKEAPESVSNPAVTKDDAHLQMLARLEWELEQRKQLATKLTETKANKETVSKDIQSKEDYLETLQPKLAAILQSTRPVQDYLDMPYDRVKEEHQKAQHLPVPLYTLYMQASAFRDACDKFLKISIQGDVDAAKSMTAFTFEVDEDSDSDQDDQDKQDSKRRRKNIEARNLEKKNRVLKRHPLSVVLEVTNEDGADLHLNFNYMVTLNIVTVIVKTETDPKFSGTCISGGDLLSPDLILDELYPGDHGYDSPNVANHYELQRHGMQEMSTYIPVIGRPYMWCQWMGGLQFLKPQGDASDLQTTNEDGEETNPGVARALAVRSRHSVSAANMQKTVTLIRERLKSRLSLLQQLSSFERCIIPLNSDCLKLFPAKINAHLTSWKRSTFDDLRAAPEAERFITSGLVKETDLIFTAMIERGSAKMTSHVVLTANCPQAAPLFIVEIMWQYKRTALSDVHVKELEEEVNLHFAELILSRSRDQLLAAQLQRLLMCFDVYLETDTPASSTVPVEIPKEKMMPRTTRGPSRAKPYRFVPELGIFTQRY